MANRSDAWLRLTFNSTKLRSGCLGLSMQRSNRYDALAYVKCESPCMCAPRSFNAGARQRYTFTFQMKPTWATLPASGQRGTYKSYS